MGEPGGRGPHRVLCRGGAGAEHEAERAIESLEIDPAILSLVCRELNERRRATGLPVITAELLAGARERILSDFYEQGLRDLPKAVRSSSRTGSSPVRATVVPRPWTMCCAYPG